MTGPRFFRYFGPVLAALKVLGDSETPAEVREAVAKNLELSDGVLNAKLSSGTSCFDNQVAWARFYFAKAGYIDASDEEYGISPRKVNKASSITLPPLRSFVQFTNDFRKIAQRERIPQRSRKWSRHWRTVLPVQTITVNCY